VPPAAGWHDTGIPVGLSADDVQRLLDGCDRAGPTGIRNFAILMLVARLGLRSIEVARLELGDIDWRAGEIAVAGKARRRDQLPLPHDVGQALQLLVETDIETGLRWGELTELRPEDFDFPTGVLTVARVVVELNPKFHPNGKRFLVKDYPKEKEWRRFRIADHLIDKIKDRIATLGLGPDDLLFHHQQAVDSRRRIPTVLPDPATLGWTEPKAGGRRYRHGTPTAYGAGRCRCEHCRNSVAAYRAARRSAGKDHPRSPRAVDTDGHIGRDWFRRHVWQKALMASGLGFHVTPHDLRHAHASWQFRRRCEHSRRSDRRPPCRPQNNYALRPCPQES
jgi:integrase